MSYILKRKKLSIPQGTFKPNYTAVGSPTVNNGVVSGFSTSKYLKLPTVFNPSSAPWEVVFKVNVTDYSNGGIIFGQRNGTYFYIRTEATGVFVTGYSNTILNGTTQIVLGKDYWVKARHDGTKLYLELSEDGINYTEENSVIIPPAFSTSSDPQYVGLWYNTYASGLYNTFQGSIDLKESYIKIGSKIWWNCKYNEDVYDTISYAAKWKIRRYYKYKYAPWSQPILTSDTSYGAVSSIGIRESQTQAYKALDGVKSGTPSTMQGWVSNTNTVGAWWMWKVPVKLKINSIKFYNQHSGNNNNIFTAQFFADQAATIPLSAPFTTLAGAYSVVDVPCIYDGITDCIYFKCLSITSNNVGIGELEISADYVTGSEVSTSDDYDFYNDVTSCYVAKRKVRRYYKYKYEDWQQPNFTGYTTGGAVVSATSEDTGDGRFAWKALQTSTQPAANTSDNYGKNNTSTAVWKVKFPYLLKISKIEHQARNWNNSIDYNTVGAYYADEAKTKKIGDVNSPSSGAWTAFNVDYLTDTILLDMTGGGSWSGIGRLKITAQKATPVEVSSTDDWDFYEDIEY